MRKLLVGAALCALGGALSISSAQDPPVSPLHEALDRYLDERWSPPADATRKLVARFVEGGLGVADAERLLRAGRAHYPEPPQQRGRLTDGIPLACDHVDYETVYSFYVPRGYDPRKAWPLVIVGHGGNGAMTRDYAGRASRGGTQPYWTDMAEAHGLLVAAPLTERGWGSIGNSIVFSLLSKVTREYHVDPDRVYMTGHSMGGHLSHRSAITFPDRWGAVSPMSGGYDYVANRLMENMFNVPGYATYGKREPYQINEFNNKMKTYAEAHRYPWVFAEKEGGHEIFADELPKVTEFFLVHPRDLYRPRVHARGGGSFAFTAAEKNERWGKEHAWRTGRPIDASTFHWLRFSPSVAAIGTAAQVVSARCEGANRIEVTCENVRKLRIYVHERMVELSRPVTVVVNGETVFEKTVAPDLGMLLELARELDDRGRVFHGAIDLEIRTDRPVPEPRHPRWR